MCNLAPPPIELNVAPIAFLWRGGGDLSAVARSRGAGHPVTAEGEGRVEENKTNVNLYPWPSISPTSWLFVNLIFTKSQQFRQIYVFVFKHKINHFALSSSSSPDHINLFNPTNSHNIVTMSMTAHGINESNGNLWGDQLSRNRWTWWNSCGPMISIKLLRDGEFVENSAHWLNWWKPIVVLGEGRLGNRRSSQQLHDFGTLDSQWLPRGRGELTRLRRKQSSSMVGNFINFIYLDLLHEFDQVAWI